VTSSREAAEAQIRVEREELLVAPEEEAEELEIALDGHHHVGGGRARREGPAAGASALGAVHHPSATRWMMTARPRWSETISVNEARQLPRVGWGGYSLSRLWIEAPLFKHVRHSVVVEVHCLDREQSPVLPVPRMEDDRGEDGGEDRPHEHSDLHVVVVETCCTECELADE